VYLSLKFFFWKNIGSKCNGNVLQSQINQAKRNQKFKHDIANNNKNIKLYEGFDNKVETLGWNATLLHSNPKLIPQGETTTDTKGNIVVLLKTHVWNDNLEKFVKKIKNEILIRPEGESVHQNIDFYILMHSNNYDLINSIKDNELRKYVLMFSEDNIKKTYSKGFYSMWLSNHWILMWFYHKFWNKYKYYWSMEYDVRISGNSLKIWKYSGSEDFIYPIEPFKNPNWAWKNHYVGGKLNDDTKYYGYLQLARYSNKFLDYLDKIYRSGENGQDEMITFSLFKRGQNDDKTRLTGSKDLLAKLIKNSWSVDNSESDKNKKSLEESESEFQTDKNYLRIFHPVK
jgi:hypothetical protein